MRVPFLTSFFSLVVEKQNDVYAQGTPSCYARDTSTDCVVRAAGVTCTFVRLALSCVRRASETGFLCIVYMITDTMLKSR